jgi:hypothetical protein
MPITPAVHTYALRPHNTLAMTYGRQHTYAVHTYAYPFLFYDVEQVEYMTRGQQKLDGYERGKSGIATRERKKVESYERDSLLLDLWECWRLSPLFFSLVALFFSPQKKKLESYERDSLLLDLWECLRPEVLSV